MAAQSFHIVREFRFRLHWPPYCRWLDVPATALRACRWLRLLVCFTKIEREFCGKMGVGRLAYAAEVKKLGIRRYR